MNTWRILLLIAASLALAGCESVLVQQPLGDEVVALDPAVWQGTWAGDEVVMVTTVLDSEKGVMQAAWLERGADGAIFESVTGTVRRTGEWVFLNMEHQINQAPSEPVFTSPVESLPLNYLWARIENDGHRTLLWWPNVEQFRQAIEAGLIPGTIQSDDDVLLGTLTPEQLESINSPFSQLLSWSEPLVFVRIGL